MLNLKNTLDGYLKNVEVIGNTIQDTNNLANIRSVGDKVEGQELYNISIQVDNGNGVSEVVEILSPVQLEKVGDVADRIICKDGVWGVDKKVNAEVKNNVLVNTRTKSEFIPLPHDQQVKLRTFAGQTNIAFLTEIPGQIKAQVPKSLGATVNTHTEQIAELHNSLDRVKKLEETTVSTIETESNFTTVDATSNGYFEDVKLEGKTLVNLTPNETFSIQTNKDNGWESKYFKLNRPIKPNTVYTVILNVISNSANVLNFYFGGKGNTFESNLLKISGLGRYVVKATSIANGQDYSRFFVQFNDNYDIGEFACQVLLLEGDHTNNPPEFFEGLMSVGQDVDEVSIESVNENLFNVDKVVSTDSNYFKCYEYIQYRNGSKLTCLMDDFEPNTQYSFRFTASSSTSTRVIFCCKYTDGTSSKWEMPYVGANVVSEGKFTSILGKTIESVGSFYSDGGLITLYIDGTCINKGDNSISYVPYQSNKKTLLYYNTTSETWEKPILREWDTIEKHSDGKYYYHKRSGEVVLNGSEYWNGFTITDSACKAYTFTLSNKAYGFTNLICDRLPVTSTYASDPKYTWGISGTELNNALWVSLNIDATDLNGFKAWLQTNNVTVVYQLAQEEVYECTNIDLMTYSGETNYIINSGAISPKSLLKVHNNISNVVKILQEKVSLLENTFIAGLKSVLSGDMYSLATILYPEDFEQNDNTEQDIMVIPE